MARGWSDEERDAIATTSKRLGRRPPLHPGGRVWTAKELKLLGTASDEEVAASDEEVAVKFGRTVNAVRCKRRKIGIA